MLFHCFRLSLLTFSALILGFHLHFGTAVASENTQSKSARPIDNEDDDEDGPDYYEGKDAPTQQTINTDNLAKLSGKQEEELEPRLHPLWMDVTGNGFLSTQQNGKESGFAACRLGRRFNPDVPLDLYLQGRLDRDQRNIEWTNHVDAGAGLRLSLSNPLPISLSVEGVGGEYLRSSYSLPVAGYRDRNPTGFFTEFRSKLESDFKWGQTSDFLREEMPLVGFPLRFLGEIEFELFYSLLYRQESPYPGLGTANQHAYYQNLTFILHPEWGYLIEEGQLGNLVAYGTLRLHLNTRGDWWNDLVVAGPGLSYQPFQSVQFFVKSEYVTGAYLWNGRPSDIRPYPAGVHDLRLFMDLTYDIGL